LEAVEKLVYKSHYKALLR